MSAVKNGLKKKTVAVKKEAGLPTVKETDELFGQYEGAGMEEATADDYAIPMLQVLQALSPQVDKKDEKFIKGAEVGMFLHSLEARVFDGTKGLLVVPCKLVKSKVEWILRENGGGIVEVHPWDYDVKTDRDDKNRDITEAGTQIVDTLQVYCYLLGADGPEPLVVNFTSTKLKVCRRWNTLISKQKHPVSGKTLPMFSHVYRLTTIQESNKKGEKYYNFNTVTKVSALGVSDRGVIADCINLYEAVGKGDVKGQMDDEGEVVATQAVDDGESMN